MRQNLYRHIAALLLAVVAMTSIMQFHHHCCGGEIHIHVSKLGDIVIGGEHLITECHHGTVNPEHHSAHHHNDDCCSLHLSDSRLTKYSTPHLPSFDTFDLSATYLIAESPEKQITSIIVLPPDKRPQCCDRTISALRAPPMMENIYA